MIGLFVSIVIFNYLAIKTVNKLSGNLIAHIWIFTIAFQVTFDVFADLKFKGYWYFSKGVDWIGLPAYTLLIPPVNLMIINWYPFKKSIWRRLIYIGIWEILLLSYEALTTLPEPWGYFHYGWWRLRHSAIINPILMFILFCYFRLAKKLENKVKLVGSN
jgi:hypothetical protein